VLARMNRMSRTSQLREHVTTIAYERPEWFRIEHIRHAIDLSEMRWTVDTAEDLEFVRRIFAHFGHDHFKWKEVLPVLDEHTEWSDINRAAVTRATG